MNKYILESMLKKNISDRDIFHDLMQYRVREILLVSTYYDAYIIEREGGLSEMIFGEYSQLNISNAPRITSVSTEEKALKKLKRKKYDMVIIMLGVEKSNAFITSKSIKEKYPKLPLLLLLHNNSDMKYLKEHKEFLEYIDDTFVWNGDSRIFLAMIKIIEDRINVKKDTKKGDVRVILLVENSIRYYSRYLPILYTVIMKQTQRMLKDEYDDFYKLLRMRGRAKVLLAQNYEEAIEYYHKYKDYLLCLISDVEYDKNGVQDPEAGLDLIKYVQKDNPLIPTLLQSSNIFNAPKAHQLNSRFLHKHSENLLHKLKEFFVDSLGFGDFVFRDVNGKRIASAHTVKEFIDTFDRLPDETIIYHADRSHFSTWFIARGKIKIAKKIKPQKVSEFKTIKALRKSIVYPLKKELFEKVKGEVVDFSDSDMENIYITKVSKGSLGGKGRGLAFANHILTNLKLSKIAKDINIQIPRTIIIGTEAFDQFLENNNILDEKLFFETDFRRIKGQFLNSNLPSIVIKQLNIFLKRIKGPIAVRSSGLFEDSLLHPFAGVYHTYLLPNNSDSFEKRMFHLTEAIKLVYASVFNPEAKNYFEAVGHKIEEEKMAVIIQEVVGNEYNGKFYPHISGVAQSYNYYPISHMEAEDGICVLALGLGHYVVDGENAYRFCPKYPKIEIGKDQFIATQSHFYSIDMEKNHKFSLFEGESATLLKSSIEDAQNDGTLNNVASTFDVRNRRITPGAYGSGPKIINFANILKYNYIPLADTVGVVLDIFEEGLGNPIEVEFAVDLTKDKKGKATFYLLQIKPLIKGDSIIDVDFNSIEREKLLIYSENTLGNGIVDGITDIIYIDNNKFDKSKTLEMVKEIDDLNKKMKDEDRRYILIGPGRWGSSDRWLGIPIVWTQISNAKVIIETDLEGYTPDSSSGSHFFHNLISMGVGYFTIKHDSKTDFIDYDKFDNVEILKSDGFFKHIRFKDELTIMMNGKNGISLVIHKKDAQCLLDSEC